MVVESPTKASKIQKFLGDNFKVLASYGHVRDLLNKGGSVRPDQDFDMVWQVSSGGEGRLKELVAASVGCSSLVLATDPDREGEAISWHITQELQVMKMKIWVASQGFGAGGSVVFAGAVRRGVLPRPGLTLQRVTFTEVTQKAVKEALQHPRQVSDDLVDAYLARRALDYLVGFSLSPLLWRRLSPAARSAGRVQSVALRLICEREDARQVFKPEEYWSMGAEFALQEAEAAAAGNSSDQTLDARLVQVDNQRLTKMSIRTKEEADTLTARLWQQEGSSGDALLPPPHGHVQQKDWTLQQQQQQQQQPDALQDAHPVLYTVRDVSKKPLRRNPPPPLVTSTLQQEAARRLGFSATKTMQVAQQLYEGANTGKKEVDSAQGVQAAIREGLITYMRTDGVNLSPAAVDGLREVVAGQFGLDHLPASGPRVYKSRAKNAQEAHEAIRPTDPTILPQHIAPQLTEDQTRLYDLIWRRAMASQMESAALEQVTVELMSPCNSLLLRCSGSSLVFPGYQAVWLSSRLAGQQTEGQESEVDGVTCSDGDEGAGSSEESSSTSSSSFISKVLSKLHIGQKIQLLQVHPAQHFTEPPPRYNEASMVKIMEELGVGRPSTYAPIMRLLQTRGYVSKAARSLVPTPVGRVLTGYLILYFPEYVDVNFTAKVEEQLDEVSAGSLPWKKLMAEFWGPLERAVAAANKAADPRLCPVCGGRLVLKPSRATGGFIGCSNHSSTGCSFGRPLWPDAEESLLLSDEEEDVAAAAAAAATGAASGEGFNDAGGAAGGGNGGMGIIGSSRLLGVAPDSGASVWVKRGPFGLYLQLGDDAGSSLAGQEHGSSSSSSKSSRGTAGLGPVRTSLPRGQSWASLTLDDALQLLALPRTVGVHPDSGEVIQANNGRFGPYLRHKSLFVTLPKGQDPLGVALEEALQLITAKEGKLRARGQDPYEPVVCPSLS
eukprot:gene13174-13305_t